MQYRRESERDVSGAKGRGSREQRLAGRRKRCRCGGVGAAWAHLAQQGEGAGQGAALRAARLHLHGLHHDVRLASRLHGIHSSHNAGCHTAKHGCRAASCRRRASGAGGGGVACSWRRGGGSGQRLRGCTEDSTISARGREGLEAPPFSSSGGPFRVPGPPAPAHCSCNSSRPLSMTFAAASWRNFSSTVAILRLLWWQ